MQISNIPTKFNIGFASSAGPSYIRSIPQLPTGTAGQASLQTGFPPENFQPIAAGGVPPFGQDFNGLFNQVTLWSRWQNAGGMVPFDGIFATAISGYPQGAIVTAASGNGFWYCLIDNNLNNPDTALNPLAAGWLGFFAPVQYLTANADYYVNPATGNDGNNGIAATVGSGNGPWATLSHAAAFVSQFNLNGFNINIHCADSLAYTPVSVPSIGGAGNVNWIGNTSTPGNCRITGSQKSCIVGAYCGQSHIFSGFALAAAGTYIGDPMLGVHVFGSGSKMQLTNMSYGACLGGHYSAEQGATLIITGTETVTGGCAGSVGGNGSHASVSTAGQIQTPAPISCSVTTAVSFAAGWVTATNIAFLQILYSSLTGGASVTGKRYTVSQGGGISTNGGGATYYPGTIAGTADAATYGWYA